MQKTNTTGYLSLTNLELITPLKTSPGISPMMRHTLPVDRQDFWQTSAVWGTKSNEDFIAPWEANALWGTSSAHMTLEAGVSRMTH